jgi:tetratricopeptide (TPR) repeat protein
MQRLLVKLMLAIACLFFLNQRPTIAKDEWLKKQGGPHTPTPLELKSLPPVCTTRFSLAKDQADPEDLKQWRNYLGEAFIHIHHHCYALNFLNRINRGIGDKNTLLGLALGDFQYMQRHVREDNILRPEIEYSIGQVLYQMNRIPEAIAPIGKAIQLKPDYVQAYLLLSFCYAQMGESTMALEILQKGLARLPNSHALQEALKEFSPKNRNLTTTGIEELAVLPHDYAS